MHGTPATVTGADRGLDTPRRDRDRRTGAQHVRCRRGSLAEDLDIHEWFDRRALRDGRGVSGGVRRRTAFPMAAVAPVPLVILDEPSIDVDASCS
ncbi:hypothetical protein [Streptomyces sp. NPDC088746]|uniref:hypothetical protein n=1 Tax=Streptomyces sp. NPDC088746 TaxID=3365885 RepID=UPI00380E2206